MYMIIIISSSMETTNLKKSLLSNLYNLTAGRNSGLKRKNKQTINVHFTFKFENWGWTWERDHKSKKRNIGMVNQLCCHMWGTTQKPKLQMWTKSKAWFYLVSLHHKHLAFEKHAKAENITPLACMKGQGMRRAVWIKRKRKQEIHFCL